MPSQKKPLLAAAAEDHGVAALKSDHTEAAFGKHEQKLFDLALHLLLLTAVFAHIDQLGCWVGQLQNLLADQAVVENHLGFLQHLPSPQG